MRKIMHNKEGVSLIFVLAFMLLLMALSVSALTAAGLSFRAVFRQQERNQRMLLVESMGLTVREALEFNDPGGLSLTEILLEAIYNELNEYLLLANEFESMGDFWAELDAWIQGGMVGPKPMPPDNDVSMDAMDIVVRMTAPAPAGVAVDNAHYVIEMHVSGENFVAAIVSGGYSIQEYFEIPNPDPALPPLLVAYPHLTRIPAEIVFNGIVTVNQRLYYGDDLQMETRTTYTFRYGRVEIACDANGGESCGDATCDICGSFVAMIPAGQLRTPPELAFPFTNFMVLPVLEMGEVEDEYGYPQDGYVPTEWERWTLIDHVRLFEETSGD